MKTYASNQEYYKNYWNMRYNNDDEYKEGFKAKSKENFASKYANEEWRKAYNERRKIRYAEKKLQHSL